MGFLKNLFGSGDKTTPTNTLNSTTTTATTAAAAKTVENQKSLTYCVEATKLIGAERDAMLMIVRLTGYNSATARRILSSVPVVFMKELDRGDAEFVRDRLKEAGVAATIHPSSALNPPAKLIVFPNAVERIYVEKVPEAKAQNAQETNLTDVQETGVESSGETTVTWGYHPKKGNFDVELIEFGVNKVKVIKETRELTRLGLKEAKQLVDETPSMVLRGVSEEDAIYAKGKLEAVGADVMVYETSAMDGTRDAAILPDAVTERRPPTQSGYSSSSNSQEAGRVYPGRGEWNVDITDVGPNKVKLIKVIRELTGLGLKDAKQVTDDAPCTFLCGLTSEDAAYAKAQMEKEGATVRVY